MGCQQLNAKFLVIDKKHFPFSKRETALSTTNSCRQRRLLAFFPRLGIIGLVAVLCFEHAWLTLVPKVSLTWHDYEHSNVWNASSDAISCR